MSELPALLQACKDAPDEDVPRLVLADWLEENGQPERAEFTRLQCQLDDLPADDPDHAILWARSATLLRKHGPEWLGPLAQRYDGVTFSRGLIEVATTVGQLVERPLEEVPEDVRAWVEGVKLERNYEDDLRTLLDRDGLRWVTSLDLNRLGWGGREVGKLDHPAASQLRRLDLWMGYVQEAEFERLAKASFPQLRVLLLGVADVALGGALGRASWLGGLRELSVGWVGNKAPNLQGLADAPPAALKRLTIVGCCLGDEALMPLAGLADLTHLDLSMNQLTGKGLAAMVKTASWPRLQTLRLGANRLGATGLGALAGSSWLESIRTLDLEDTGATAVALTKVLDRSHLAHLRVLNLSGNRVGDAGAGLLASSERLGSLTALHLASAGLTAEGVAHLGRSTTLKSLRFLDLSGNNVGTEGLEALREATGLPALAGLELSKVQASPQGLAALAESPLLPRLRRLNLDCNHQRPEALRPLLAEGRLEALRDLDLSRNPLGEEGLRLLAGSAVWRRLVQLSLARTDLKDSALRALSALPAPAKLVSLNLANNPFRRAEDLRGWRHRRKLLRLGLKDADLSGEEQEGLEVGPEWES